MCVLWRLCFVAVLVAGMASCGKEKIDFNTQVKPILNKRCISCHGGVKKNGDFSVLFREEALDTTRSGKPAIIPGHPERSEMIRRLTARDPEVRMPYKEEPLTEAEIAILSQWIEEGAEWGTHWAYIPPDTNLLRGGHTIDKFIAAGLEAAALEASPRADKPALLRRVHLDITGVPPTLEEAEQFLNDTTAGAYQKVVDRLLASPQFGEKWASWWLDLARYADTKGYERDASRNIWRYRDWVIRAFNEDKPFDKFTIEQLAGDLLPNPSDDQMIATAFHRNTMNNDEGGTEDEEFRVAALIDRVGTTWEVWQSTTMACVQCHSHPYDPFVHEDYYKSLAFFNNSRDEDTYGEHPTLRIYEPADQKKVEAIRDWILRTGDASAAEKAYRFLKTQEPKYHAHAFDDFVEGELIDTKWLGIRSGGRARLKQIDLSDVDFALFNHQTGNSGGVVTITIDKPDGRQIGKATISKTKNGFESIVIPLEAVTGKHDLFFTFVNPAVNPGWPVTAVEWIAFQKHFPGAGTAGFSETTKTYVSLLNTKADETPVMVENEAAQFRETFMFERGNWLVKGKPVRPGTPETLNPYPPGAPTNRLGFAHWLFATDNPLTARSMVNKIWDQIFGAGIVETIEDFGTQGSYPSHPELLDWLAVKFRVEMQWSMKKLIREIVMSETYCQSSQMTPGAMEKDPFNRLLSRAPRVRLTAEQVRDQALAAGGLLSAKMYGPPVMPFQPQGIWNTVYSGDEWIMSEGEDQFRRSVYTFAKRTSPYPTNMLFDGSSREFCVSRRIRTNTPLQALATLNDSTYVMAANALASRMKVERTPEAQLRLGYRILLSKEIPAAKLNVLMRIYQESLQHYTMKPVGAHGTKSNEHTDAGHAALTAAAQVLLNLDEVIMKE